MGIRHSKKCEVLPDIRKIIKSSVLVVFVSSTSRQSFETIELLRSLNLNPAIIDLDIEANVSGTKQALFQLTGQYDLPLIFLKNSFYGSLKELKQGVKLKSFQSLLARYGIKFVPIDSLIPSK